MIGALGRADADRAAAGVSGSGPALLRHAVDPSAYCSWTTTGSRSSGGA